MQPTIQIALTGIPRAHIAKIDLPACCWATHSGMVRIRGGNDWHCLAMFLREKDLKMNVRKLQGTLNMIRETDDDQNESYTMYQSANMF